VVSEGQGPTEMQYVNFIPAVNTIRNIFDIAIVFLLVYVVLKLLRGTRGMPTAVGMGILAFLYWIAVSQELATLEFVLRSAVVYIGIAIIVLFQTEIRQALMYFGARLRFSPSRPKGQRGETVYDEIILAATTLASEKTGALIVFERAIGLRNLIDAGVSIDGKISYDLLITIFQKSSPLHDGAVVIQNEKVAAASVFLPLTKNPNVSRDLGTRHRAAIGVTEGTDAVSLIVSEESGGITFVENGELKNPENAKELRGMLLKAMGLESTSSFNDTSSSNEDRKQGANG